jgi:hypothetical protein
MASKASAKGGQNVYQDKTKPAFVRESNISAARGRGLLLHQCSEMGFNCAVDFSTDLGDLLRAQLLPRL